jgi:MFS family permease
MVGTMCGGMLVDWWARRDERAFVWILMLSYALTTPFLLIVYVTDHLEVAMSALSGAAFVFSLQLGPLYAVVQKLAGRKMRATAAALVVMVCGTAGTTCGPVAIGMLNEALHEFGAGPAIRLSMTAMLGTFVLAAWCYWKASHTARADFRVAEAE